jgi:hypothetical protein
MPAKSLTYPVGSGICSWKTSAKTIEKIMMSNYNRCPAVSSHVDLRRCGDADSELETECQVQMVGGL